MEATVRKLTNDDVAAINAEGLNGKHLVEYDYYKVSLVDDPSVYCYARDFGGVDPEEIGPYLYVEESKYVGKILRINLAAIKNDTSRYPIITIPVRFVEDVPGTSTRIFQEPDTGKYYMRVSAYPREKFALWLIAYQRHGRWEDGSEIRANVIFSLDGQTEKVSYTNWNGPAVYEENFNEAFEPAGNAQ